MSDPVKERARELFPEWKNKIFSPELTRAFVYYWLHLRGEARDEAEED